MISLDQYFGPYCKHPDAGQGIWAAADLMLDKVNRLLEFAESQGLECPVNPRTGSQISGAENGGFRPQSCAVGAPNSKHKQGRAVDVFDPGNHLDDWITDEVLSRFELWREHPDDSPNWLHLQDAPPKSGRRTFKP